MKEWLIKVINLLIAIDIKNISMFSVEYLLKKLIESIFTLDMQEKLTEITNSSNLGNKSIETPIKSNNLTNEYVQ